MISRKPRRPLIEAADGEGLPLPKTFLGYKSSSPATEGKEGPFMDEGLTHERSFFGEENPGGSDFTEDMSPSENVIAFPPIKKTSRRKKYIVGAIATGFALIMAILLYSPLLELRTIRTTGLKLVAKERIDEALSPLKGTPLPQVTDRSVKDLLEPMVALKAVEIYRQPPHDIELRIQERIPAAVIRNNSGFVLVDVDGVQLSEVMDRTGIDLPLIDGGSAVGHDIFKAIMTVLSELPGEIVKQTDYVRANTVSTVELVLKDGKVVVWGDVKQGNIKARALSILLADSRVRAEARTVDVSAPRIPVTKK